jgi:hypothetical protein
MFSNFYTVTGRSHVVFVGILVRYKPDTFGNMSWGKKG